MTDEKTLAALHPVLQALIDSKDGYTKAAEVADTPRFTELFNRRAASRDNMAMKVRALIHNAGGMADDDGSILATMHRAFLSISALIINDDKAAIDAVDDGEEHLRDKVEGALEGNITTEAKAVLATILSELRADERLIEQMEDMIS